jgi:hypothetical protein
MVIPLLYTMVTNCYAAKYMMKHNIIVTKCDAVKYMIIHTIIVTKCDAAIYMGNIAQLSQNVMQLNT